MCGDIRELLHLVCRFIRAMQGAMGTLTQLLASSNLSDITEAISLLVCFDKFGIAGSKSALRKMLPLIFTREQGERVLFLLCLKYLYLGK